MARATGATGNGDDAAGAADAGAAHGTAPAATSGQRVPLYKRFRSRRKAALRTWWPWLFVAAVLLAAGWLLVKPAPPKRLVIAAGPRDGAYYGFALQYAENFARDGVQLEVRETAGTIDNYHLFDTDPKVAMAIVQGGAAPPGLRTELRSIASLYLEPVWVFHRLGPEARLRDFRGKRLALGPEGSGTRAFALKLLSLNGVDGADLSPLAGKAAIDALLAGRLDAAFFVIAPGDAVRPLIRDLLRRGAEGEGIHLMEFDRHEAYGRLLPYLSSVKLPRGVLDLPHDLPGRDVHLVAPAANLVMRADLHPALVPLLARAATAAHERGDLLSPPGRFPSLQFVEFPVDPAAKEYFRSGPPFLQRFLPFWVAALLDRTKILLLPLLTLLIPLSRLAPPLYVWRIRSRIYLWYRVLREIDQRLRAAGHGGTDDFSRELALLRQMERELAEVKVPLSYMQEFYNLRLHVDLVRRRLEEAKRLARAPVDRPPPREPDSDAAATPASGAARTLPALAGLALLLGAASAAPPARGAVEAAVNADGLESRTGAFDARYPLPPEAESSRWVQLLIKRRAVGSVSPPSRQELWFRGRNVERQMPSQPPARRGAQPARGARPAAATTRPAEPAVRREEHVGDPPGYQLYVPASYRPGKLYGVIVYMSPGPRGDVRRNYEELCDRHALIWIAPANTGNNRYAPWRRYMALEAAWQATRRFTVDSQRVYVCGASGGGRVASEAAIVAPETFSGGFYLIGCNYFRNLPLPDEPKKVYPGFWANIDPKVLARAKKDSRFVLLTGSNDFNRKNTKVVYDEGYAKDGFAHAAYLEVPDMGHSPPPEEWFNKGLEFLDGPLAAPGDLYREAQDLERQKKPGEAYLAYARAAARGGDADWAADAQAKADAVYTTYREQLARARQHFANPPADKAARDRAVAAVRDLRTRFGPMAERDAAELELALQPRAATRPATRPTSRPAVK